MSKGNTITMIVMGAVAILIYLSTFIVDQREKALLLQLGQIVDKDFEPGLHFKIPFFQNVQKFDSRILTLDSRPELILTGEKKNVLVDYFVKWRISGVEDYYRTFGGREFDAMSRMAQTVKDGLQAEFGNRTIREVVSGERAEIMLKVGKDVDEKVGKFGIEIIDVRIKQIELPPNVRESVFQRMRVERERIAKEHRAMGQKASLIIRAKADRARTELLATAMQNAEKIRGAGDAQSTEIYADAYGKEPQFYEFYRSLEAYRKTFNTKQDVFVMEPDSEFFKYFGEIAGSN
jgi:membrane protease subunit HflC